MTQCGNVFQDEASKFRFLNELIRLVSKKYLGAETPLPVKQRIMECLLLWTTEFPQLKKIRDAYEMLRKEGDIEHGQTAAAVAKRESVLSTIDEAMFAKLIKSKDPENFKRANLLLQYRMAQEARRNDLLAQHRLVLREVQETMQLLNQMLDTYNPSDRDVKETIHELYMSCKKHKPIFQHLPELLGESDAQLIGEWRWPYRISKLLLPPILLQRIRWKPMRLWLPLWRDTSSWCPRPPKVSLQLQRQLQQHLQQQRQQLEQQQHLAAPLPTMPLCSTSCWVISC